MDITQAVFTMIGANLVLILSAVGIAITLYLHTDRKIDAIHEEMKDFHGRLCAIEEGKRERK